MSFIRKPKQPKSICMEAFQKQFAKLHPERSKTGGIKARSASEKVRMDIYRPIAEMFKLSRSTCECCLAIKKGLPPMTVFDETGSVGRRTEDVHHIRGREGLLLFDMRNWLATCRECHNWIHTHPKEAKELGLLQPNEK